MAQQLTFSLSNEDLANKGVAAVLRVLENPRGMYEAIGFDMAEDTRLRLSEGKDIDGNPFKPSIRALEEGGQTLLDKGYLKSSISFLADDTGVVWGSAKGPTDPYARIHNFGGTIKPKNAQFLRFKVGNRWVMKKEVVMPKRQYLGFTNADLKRTKDIILEFLDNEVHQ